MHGFLPGFEAGQPNVTNHTQGQSDLWVGSWITLLAVGIVTWILILAAAIVYRRRRGQTGLPPQLRYNMPIEIFYTIVPLILVLGFFAFTVKQQDADEAVIKNPDVTVAVYAKQWAWDFAYTKENVYSAGVQAQLKNGTDNVVESKLPQLVLPLGKTVELQLRSRDVDHDFWVIDFLYKKDTIPGITNYEYFVPTRLGTYQGKCAELCGEYHSKMLFTVKVVTPAQYTTFIAAQRAAGFVGQDGYSVSRNTSNQPAQNQIVNGDDK
jgi:cytochrome c oxidase subunit II